MGTGPRLRELGCGEPFQSGDRNSFVFRPVDEDQERSKGVEFVLERNCYSQKRRKPGAVIPSLVVLVVTLEENDDLTR